MEVPLEVLVMPPVPLVVSPCDLPVACAVCFELVVPLLENFAMFLARVVLLTAMCPLHLVQFSAVEVGSVALVDPMVLYVA